MILLTLSKLLSGNTEIIELFDTKSIVEFNELAVPLKSSGNELINETCEEESVTSPSSVT